MVVTIQAVREVPAGDMIPGDMMEAVLEMMARTILMAAVVVLIIPMEVAVTVTIRMGVAVTQTIRMAVVLIQTIRMVAVPTRITRIRITQMVVVAILTIPMEVAVTQTIRMEDVADLTTLEGVRVTMVPEEIQEWEIH